MKLLVSQGNCWPTPQQELLLQAALLEGADALAAWEKWKAAVDIDVLDPGSFRLLPQLYWKLQAQGIEDPLMSKLKGVYRYTWSRNQLLLHSSAALLKHFQAAGIQTMILKGAALTVLYYKNRGLRFMSDFDVLVPTEQAARAITLLTDLGWVPDARSPERLIPIEHGIGFKNKDRQSVDLHWHLLPECRQPDADKPFWDGAVLANLEDLSTSALNPTDQLFHVCIHGAKWNLIAPFRWVADAMMILRDLEVKIEWERLVSEAQDRRLTLPLRDTLTYLQHMFDAPVPSAVLQRLRNTPTSKAEIFEYRYKTQSYLKKPLGYLPILWFDYRRSAPQDGRLNQVLGFAKHLQLLWGAKHVMLLPFYAALMGLRRILSLTDSFENR
jgi:hypothetical protein